MAESVAARQPAPTHTTDPQRASARAAQHEHSPLRPAITRLQRAVGNRAMNRLLRSSVIQPKLTVGPPDDVYEREADRVADHVMRMPEPAASGAITPTPPTVQRMCPECEKEEEKPEEEIRRMSHLAVARSPLQISRRCRECEKAHQREAGATLQKKGEEGEDEEEDEGDAVVYASLASDDTPDVPDNLDGDLAAARQGGSPLRARSNS